LGVGAIYALLAGAGRVEFPVNMPGGVEVFGCDAERFEESDVVGVGAAGSCAGEDFADLGFNGGFGDEAFLSGDEKVAGFFEEGFIAVGEEAAALDGVTVDFPVGGGTGADDVQVGTWFQPAAFHDRLGGGSDGADDGGGFCGGPGGGGGGLCGFDGGPGGGGEEDGIAVGEARFEGFGMFRVPAPQVNRVDVADPGDGFDMAFCLFAGTDDGECRCVFAGEQSGGHGAGGGGANGGDGGGVEQQQGLAVGGFEEDNDALMGWEAGGAVGVEDGNQFDADDIWTFSVARHHPQQAASIGEPHQGAQRLEDAAFGQIAEHGLHDGYALVHGEERFYFFTIYI